MRVIIYDFAINDFATEGSVIFFSLLFVYILVQLMRNLKIFSPPLPHRCPTPSLTIHMYENEKLTKRHRSKSKL